MPIILKIHTYTGRRKAASEDKALRIPIASLTDTRFMIASEPRQAISEYAVRAGKSHTNQPAPARNACERPRLHIKRNQINMIAPIIRL